MDIKSIIDIFTCKICKGILRVPKHLPCDHDVCEHCLDLHIIRTVPMTGYDLHEYLGNKPENVEIKPTQDFFVCPVEGCDNKYTVKYPKSNIVKWAGQVSNCTRRTHFIEIFHGKRKFDIKFCDACADIPGKPAASTVCTKCLRLYCQKCTLIHRSFNPTHETVDVVIFESGSTLFTKEHDNVGNDATTSGGSDHETSNEDTTTPVLNFAVCPIHRPCENVLICRDCFTLCCVKCSETKHAKCKNVNSINLLHKRLTSSKMDVMLTAKLDTLLEKIAASISKYVAIQDRLETVGGLQSSATSDTITDVTADVETYLKMFEYLYSRTKRLLLQIKHATNGNPSQFVTVMLRVEGDWIKLQEEFVKTVAATDKRQISKAVEQIEKECTSSNNASKDRLVEESGDLHDEGKGLSPVVQQKYKDILSNIQRSKHELGDDIVTALDETELQECILAKSEHDEKDCWFVDCKMLSGREIIVADAANHNIKVINGDKEITEFYLESSPWCLTINEEEKECVVSVPDLNKVIVFSVRAGVLEIVHDITTSTGIYCISTVDSEIMLTANKQGEFHLLNNNGSMESVSANGLHIQNKRSPLPRFSSILANGEGSTYIYVSDFRMNQLICCNLNAWTKCDLRLYTEKEANSLSGDIENKKVVARVQLDNNEIKAKSDAVNASVLEQLPQAPYKDTGANTCNSVQINDAKEILSNPSLEAIQYTNVKYPTGIDQDQSGNIYICCNSDHSVLKLDKDREHKFKVIEIALPRAISICGNRLVLTVDSGPQKNFVMVYNLKPLTTSGNKD